MKERKKDRRAWTKINIAEIQQQKSNRHTKLLESYRTELKRNMIDCFRISYVSKYGHTKKVACSFCNNENKNAEDSFSNCLSFALHKFRVVR